MSRKETMKVYHGILKSITDEHTIFYASLDGSIEPEIGSVDVNTASDFISDPMGYHPTSGGNMLFTATKSVDIFTLDMYVPKFPKVSSGNKGIITLKTETGADLFYIQIPSQQDYLALVQTDNTGWHTLTKSQQDCFIRIVVNKGNVTNYINGIKISQSITIKSFTKFNKIRIMLGSSTWNGIADIHISDIDRGDYFPNLPQDFIDGKAIIKPRMGQQQIKGDPLYSQYTLLKVPNANNIHSSESYKKDDYDYYVNNPELKTSGSDTWGSGSIISIKGLNGEIINGIIDSDTALAKVMLTASAPINKLQCDSVSGFSVGDTIKVFDPVSKNSTYDKIIQNIDIEAKTIFLDSTLNGDGGNWNITANQHLIIETTTSSSSPVVKTEDGTVVVGTWSGLGTNEASFTLGTNSNIVGKDLYIEYSLNIPNNNSDFNELPYNIDKAWTENGIEMTPVNEIIITDDFKGKISGSMKECPHICKYRLFNSLSVPSNIVEEIKSYSSILSIDSTTILSTDNRNGYFPQHLFSFNLIEMVERKLGCEIPSIDKVNWLRDNLDSEAKVFVYGHGSSPSGSKFIVRLWDKNNNTYNGNDSIYTNDTNSIKQIVFRITSLTINRITDDGFVHAIAFTDASDGTTASTIYTDYISIEIKLKTDSTFTTLYCKNTRAREDKCNPVLIQKETKTVKRYLPSKECFTTECRYVDQKGISISTSKIYTVLFELPSVYITTQGTGSYNSIANDFAKNCLSFLGISSTYKYCNEDISDFDVSGYSYNTIRFNQVPTVFYYNGVKYIPSKLPDRVINVATLYPCIVNYNGELYLHLSIITYINKVRDTINYYLYPITNRPLLK